MAVALPSLAAVRLVAGAVLTALLAYSPSAYAQIRPVPPIEPPIINPPIEPPIVRPPIPPIVPPIATPDAKIVGDTGIVVGTIGRAAVELPAQNGVAPPPSGSPRTTSAPAAVYRWTILNGRLLSDPADAVAEFTSSAPGSITLGVSVTADGVSYSTSTRIAVMPATIAGAISVPTSVTTSNTATVTASVPAAVNNDRTFRWSVSDDARIMRGQNSAEIAFRPGSPGMKELTCVVTLQNLGSVTLRSYVDVTGAGAPVAVAIEGGSGGGVFPADSRVVVMADPPAPGTVFDRWVGDVASLGSDPFAVLLPQGIVTVPATPIALAATYRPTALWSPKAMAEANPRAANLRAASAPARTLYHVPNDARGLVFLLHDTGGTAVDWFERADQLLLVRSLVDAGFGVAAVTSASRAWSGDTSLLANADAQAMVSLWERLTRDHGFPAARPVFLAGLGSGAQAAARIAHLLKESEMTVPVHGALLLCGTSTEDLAGTTRVPVFLAVAARDASPGYAGSAAARANADLLTGRGVAAQMVETGVTPIPARRLLKLAALDPAFTSGSAHDLWNALRSAEVVDAGGYVKQVLSVDAARAVVPVQLQRFSADVAAQLQAAAAGRGVSSELAARIIDFLAQRIAAVAAATPARLTNMSSRNRVAYVGDSFSLGFALEGSDRAAVLVRAVGPGLARFGVSNRCLATRLELYQGSTLVAANEGWDDNRNDAAQITAATNAVGAFPLTAGSADGAVLLSLGAGTYQVVVRGVNGTTGDVLAEAFDVSRNATRFVRFHTSGRVDDAATQSLVSGFVVQGSAPRTLLCRALGPTLMQLGRPAASVMADPMMSVRNAAGSQVAVNDNWGDSELLGIAALRSGLRLLSAGSRDAALLTAVQAGSYTIEVAAAASATSPAEGEVMIEVAEVP